MEYHLRDLNNQDVKLSFDDVKLTSLKWQQWLDANPQKDMLTEIAQEPDQWKAYPEYVTYNYVWQNLAGQSVELGGQFVQSGVFRVSSIKQVEATVRLQNTASTPAVSSTLSLSTYQVTFVGKIVITNNNPQPRGEHMGHLGAFLFKVTDMTDKEQEVLIYDDQPNCQTSITFGNESYQTSLSDFRDHWAQFTGWVFYPPRITYHPNTIVELQSVRILPPTLTPNP